MESGPLRDSAYARRARLFKLVSHGVVDHTVVLDLIRDGKGISDEAVLWDFKRNLPVIPKEQRLSAEIQEQLDFKLAEIVKDCVAFYNSYGGYLVVGIDDGSREIVGFNELFDASVLNKKIKGATNVSIETIFRTCELEVGNTRRSLGILFIPRRPYSERPVAFQKASLKNSRGKSAYNANDIYLRERDECRKAISAEDFEFLLGSGRRDIEANIEHRHRIIDNNLPQREADLQRLVGREDELAALWAWFNDPFAPTKVICGLGGVGKTSLAYTFCERVYDQAPSSVDKIVWLSAKKQRFSAVEDALKSEPRVDFNNVISFLVSLLLEIGCPEQQIPNDPSLNELIKLVESHLSEYSYLAIVDDVDSLNDDDQQRLFQLIIQLFAQARRGKAIITARRNLGAAISNYIELRGLDFDKFKEFLEEKCQALGLRSAELKRTENIERLYKASGGSPLFALSILRLMALGDDFFSSLRHWSGSDGEMVRDAAFAREVGRLKASEARVLLALCYLKEASLIVLRTVTGLNRYDVQQALEALRAFSMTSIAAELPDGATFAIPQTLILATSVVEKKVQETAEIKKRCAEHNKIFTNQPAYIGGTVQQAMAYLEQGEPENAILAVETAIEHLPNNPDLRCLLGRCYLEGGSGKMAAADEAFRHAYDLGCRRIELFDFWLRAKNETQEWKAAIEIANLAINATNEGRYVYRRAVAAIKLADAHASAGALSEAEKIYLTTIEELKAAIKNYGLSADRGALREIQQTAIHRWIGVISMEANRGGQPRRFFGAVTKVTLSFGYFDASLIRLGIQALDRWLSDLERRRALSEKIIEQLNVDYQKVVTLSAEIYRREFADEVEKEAIRNALDLAEERISALGRMFPPDET